MDENDTESVKALTIIHNASVEEVAETSVSSVTTAISNETDPILNEILQAGVDWLPRDILDLKTKKAPDFHSDGRVVLLPSTDTLNATIVPSTKLLQRSGRPGE